MRQLECGRGFFVFRLTAIELGHAGNSGVDQVRLQDGRMDSLTHVEGIRTLADPIWIDVLSPVVEGRFIGDRVQLALAYASRIMVGVVAQTWYETLKRHLTHCWTRR